MRSGHSILTFGVALLMASTPAFAAESIRIGMFAELTGANAEFGKESVNGAVLAAEELNLAGGVLGRPLEIVTEDNQSNNPGSEVAVSKLLGSGNIKAIISSPRSTQVLAVMPAIAQAGVPTLACGTLYTLTHANNPWMFRVAPHDGYLAKAIADFGTSILKKKKWAIVHTEESYGIAGRDMLAQELKALGVAPPFVQGVGYSVQNLAPLILAIKNSAPDIVAMYFARPEVTAEFAKQLRAAGMGSVLIGGSGVTSKAVMRIAGAALHDSYSLTAFTVEATAHSRAFARKYREKTGGEPDQHAAWAYDAVHLVARAITIAASVDATAIRKGLHAIRGFNGAAGAYTFDRNGDGRHGFDVVKNDNGKLVTIKTISYLPK